MAPPPDAVPGSARDPAPSGLWRRLELVVFASLLVAALGLAALLGSAREGRQEPREFDVIRAKAFEAALEFELPDLEGQRVRLQDFRGRVVFLNFWATWCVPCREEMPEMVRLARELGGDGLVVLAVNYKETPEEARAFAREYGVTFPVLLDATGEVGERYRVQALPMTYLIDREGGLAGTVLGFRRWDSPEARAYLRELLAGRKPSA